MRIENERTVPEIYEKSVNANQRNPRFFSTVRCFFSSLYPSGSLTRSSVKGRSPCEDTKHTQKKPLRIFLRKKKWRNIVSCNSTIKNFCLNRDIFEFDTFSMKIPAPCRSAMNLIILLIFILTNASSFFFFSFFGSHFYFHMKLQSKKRKSKKKKIRNWYEVIWMKPFLIDIDSTTTIRRKKNKFHSFVKFASPTYNSFIIKFVENCSRDYLHFFFSVSFFSQHKFFKWSNRIESQ